MTVNLGSDHTSEGGGPSRDLRPQPMDSDLSLRTATLSSDAGFTPLYTLSTL